MADANETLDAIIAEMRAARNTASDTTLVSSDWLDDWANRIKAAVARERNAHTNDIHDALYKATGIPGNAAAMRAALVSVKEKLSGWWEWLEVEDAVEAALAAPARNADRPECKTLPDAIRFGHFECGHREWWVATMTSANWHDFADWLFDPAKEDPKP
jgi:hypothetical protein